MTEVLGGPTEYGGRTLLGPHHVEWSEAINNHQRILALASRDHGKSFNFCFAYPLWKVDRNAPGSLGYIFSASGTQAEEHLDKIRREVIGGGEHWNGEPNPKLAHLRPLRKDTAKKVVFANGGEIRARGFGSRVRGGHPPWLVCDDVGNDEWIWSQLVRKKAIDYFLSAIEPMVPPHGQLIIVSTPFHAQDLYKHLDDTGEFHTMRHPALLDDGEPLWPQRYSKAELDRRRRMRSSIQWSREYMVQPITDDASIFPSHLFEIPGVKQPYALGLTAEHWQSRGFDVYAGVDLAMSSSASADWFVMFVMARDPATGDRYVVDIIRRRGLGYQEQVDTIVQASKRYGCGLVFVEANQYQRVITDMIVRTSDIPIKAFYTTGKRSKSTTTTRRGMKQTYSASKNALDQGVPALRMLFENAKIKIPWAPETRELVKVWITELQAFGWAEGKLQGVGANDDTVMATWICDHAIQVAGSMSLGTESSDDGSGLVHPSESDVDFFGGTRGGGDDQDADWRPKPNMPGPWGGLG